MTQTDKLITVIKALLSVKGRAINLEREAEDYDMSFHRSYTQGIIRACDEAIKALK